MITLENVKEHLKGYTALLIDGDTCGCAGCYALNQELQPACISKGVEFKLVTSILLSKEFKEKYEITTLPVALLFKDDILLGRINSYQPQEIIEIWLDSKIK